jgi:hypothetical protein
MLSKEEKQWLKVRTSDASNYFLGDEGFLLLLFTCSCRSITSDVEISSSLTSKTISVHSSGFAVRPNEGSGSPLAPAVFRSTGIDRLSFFLLYCFGFWFRISSSVCLVLYSRKLLIYMDIWAPSRRRARCPERISIFSLSFLNLWCRAMRDSHIRF